MHDMPLGTMEIHFSSIMPSCICHMERNICDNFTLRFRDEESHGTYSDLDLETNGSHPDCKPLPSEEMHSLGQDINILDIILLSSLELHVPVYRWKIVVRVIYLRVHVCNCQLLHFPVTYTWTNTKDQRWTYERTSGALGIPNWAEIDLYLGQKQHKYVISTAEPQRPANAD